MNIDRLAAEINAKLAAKESSQRIELGEMSNVITVWQNSRRNSRAIHHGRESDTVNFLLRFSEMMDSNF